MPTASTSAPLASRTRREDGATAATFVIDETLRLLGADTAGHALLEEEGALRLALGRICTGSQSHNTRIRECITSGASLVGLKLGDGVVLTLTPVSSADADTMAARHAVATVQIAAATADAVDLVCEACGLTGAEGEVLRLIYKGFSTVEAARIAGVAKSTVRSHLQRVFAKTETSRQSELVHFVATSQRP